MIGGPCLQLATSALPPQEIDVQTTAADVKRGAIEGNEVGSKIGEVEGNGNGEEESAHVRWKGLDA